MTTTRSYSALEGSIVFHTDDREVALYAGDRSDLAPGTKHAATVGPQGCRYVEATKPPNPKER